MLPSFANILLSGPCNLACCFCIGKYAVPRPNNLDQFRLASLQSFLDQVKARHIRDISISGTNTDPLLYRHKNALLQTIRAALPSVRINLHTNGLLAFRYLDFVNNCDRLTLSLSTLRPSTARLLTGSPHVLDLASLLPRLHIPAKLSSVLLPENVDEIPQLILLCQSLGIKRLALRKLVAPPLSHAVPVPALPALALPPTPSRFFAQNPVYDLPDLEVTLWDFDLSSLRCLNLFSDGTMSDSYSLLTVRH
jgi:molybdenum cofactor biosynthesis enzyme MoaA